MIDREGPDSVGGEGSLSLAAKRRMRKVCAGPYALSLLVLGAASQVHAGGGPENLLLVVNADKADSLTVANEYVRLREVPPTHIVYLAGLPPGSQITVEDFRARILRPVLETMQRRGLAGQIDYVVYSAGFPFAVEVSKDIEGKAFPAFLTQPASLTGLTYLYELVLIAGAKYLALDANRYMRTLKGRKSDTPWTDSDKNHQADLQKLFAKLQEGRPKATEAIAPESPEKAKLLQEAATLLQSLTTAHPNDPEILYNLACILALQNKPEEAMTSLTAAYESGWWNAELTQADPDLASLRERNDFKAVLEKMRQVVIQPQPAQAFHNTEAWGRNDDRSDPKEGRHYLLSAMLAYTGGPANTLAEALGCLRQSSAADGTRPTGTVYFMVSEDWARTGPRQWAFRSAVEALSKLGVRAEVLSGVLPKDKSDVAGVMVGAAGFAWKDCGSRILPGAFCDHLTSFGGVMTGAGQTLLSEFLRYGAAAACGAVTEPYNVPSKFPSPFFHFYYVSGCSLAEAFYQSVHGPYQQLLVGDPLCQPWAKTPVVSVKGMASGEALNRPRRLTPTARSVEPISRFELFVDGRRLQSCIPGKSLRLDPTGLTEGYHEARVVGIAGPLEMQGRVLVPFRVGKRTVSVEGWPTETQRMSGALRLTAKLPGARRIAFLHNEREVGTVEGERGTVEIQLASLGLGTVALQPVAWLSDGCEVRGPPHGVVVEEAAP